jgi:hypothetical protein
VYDTIGNLKADLNYSLKVLLTVTGIESVVTFNNTLIQAFSSLPDGCVN